MNTNQFLALHHVAMLDQQSGNAMHLDRHFAAVDDRRRRRRQRFTPLFDRKHSVQPLVPPRVRLAG